MRHKNVQEMLLQVTGSSLRKSVELTGSQNTQKTKVSMGSESPIVLQSEVSYISTPPERLGLF